MPRRIAVLVTCDVCGHETDDEPYTLKLNRREVELDLCPMHRDEITESLEAFLEHGHKVNSKKAPSAQPKAVASTPAEPTEEPEADRTCNQCHELQVSRGALRQHLRNRHGLSMAEAGLAKGNAKAARAGRKAAAA